jgi:hypothetical protein
VFGFFILAFFIKEANEMLKGEYHSKESKKKMSSAHKGKKLTEEHKRKISEAYVYKRIIPWNKKDIPKQELYQKYIIEKLSQKKVGEFFGISQNCINRNLNSYGFSIRTISETKKGSKCIKEKCPVYKGGKWLTGNGYQIVLIYPDNPFFSMTAKGKGVGRPIQEHRLVMAKHLDRCIESWEQVHHKNGIKIDNRIENLELVDNVGHSGFHRQVKALEKEIKELRELLLMAVLVR